MEEEQQLLRKGILKIIDGHPINMAETSFPYSQEATDRQQQVEETPLE